MRERESMRKAGIMKREEEVVVRCGGVGRDFYHKALVAFAPFCLNNALLLLLSFGTINEIGLCF